MKIIETKVYSLNELSKEAREKAHNEWIAHNDYYFLSDYLNERLHELLEENHIKDTNDTSKAGTTPTPVRYSFSYSQGDGAMFEGTYEWKGHTVAIRHSGRYYHENSKSFEITNSEGEYATEAIEKEFDSIYVDICKQLKRYGYDFIENEDSFENFEQACESNDYTFTSAGKMENY